MVDLATSRGPAPDEPVRSRGRGRGARRPPAMTRRDVVRAVFEGRRPPYVPWQYAFTVGAKAKLVAHLGPGDLEAQVGNHMLMFKRSTGSFAPVGEHLVRDMFGVIWDRSMDADIGFPVGLVLPEPTLAGLALPDPLDPRFYLGWDDQVATAGDRFRVFSIGFSLYERAWTLRGMENLHDGLLRPPRLRPRTARSASPTTTSPRSGRRCGTTSTPSTSATTGASSAACRWAGASGASSSTRVLARACTARSATPASSS